MTFVALALIVMNAAVAAGFVSVLRSMQRAHARREDLLVNQVMHLAGKSWTPPPADHWTAAAAGDPLVAEFGDWTAAPEQQPLYE